MTEASALPVVILSTADFDASVWTNKQHIAVRLAADRPVYYIESLGLRRPSFALADLRRIVAKLTSSSSADVSSPARAQAANVTVITPRVIPWHGSRCVRWLNQGLIKRLRQRLPRRYDLWTFSPLTYGLERQAETVVYHSVDLLHTLPGLPRTALLQAERRLIGTGCPVVTSSRGVAAHICAQGGTPALWENVADIDLFSAARAPVRERRVIFVGNLTPTKIDFTLLEGIVARGMRLALAGPEGIDGTQRDSALRRLRSSGLVEYLGVLSQAEMAVELGKSWLGIIPYQVNDYTSGVFPMKVYEYLAAGLPVVATPIASLSADVAPGVEVVAAEAFIDSVEAIYTSAHESPPGDYQSNSWEARVAQVRALLASRGARAEQ